MEKRIQTLEQRLEVQEDSDRKVQQLEHKIGKLESTNRELGGNERINVDVGRLKKIEKRIKMKEREERRNNIIMKGLN